MIKHYIHKNIGELFTRYKIIDKFIKQTKDEIEVSKAEDCTFLFGKYAALTDYRASSHTNIVDALINTKSKIENLDDDFYENEIVFNNGYINGLELILEADRSFFDDRNDIVVFVFSIDENMRNDYELVFQKTKHFSDFYSEGKNRYYVSGDVEDIKNKAMQFDENTEFVIIVAYDKNCLPDSAIMNALSFAEDYNVFLHRVKENESVEQMIKRTLKSTIV